MDIMGNIYDEYKHRNDILNIKKTTKELVQIESEFTDAENECQDYLIESKDESSVATSASGVVRRARVNSGDKAKSKPINEEKEVEVKPDQLNTSCIDQAPTTKEYKLLQLRQYVEGDALQVIENLGHSAVAYDAAKERLESRYGGQRRQITLYIEELENFKPMREGFAKDIEKFADLLYIAVVNLKEAGRFEDRVKEWFFVQQIAAKDDRIYGY
ncbi:unnamed protein product [Mytilus coruscus]|uniref:Uncharacterized protein n=1 Tax=Mytilus coruscus TaxID=42192 RepID=A0A6J8AX24_MYTCO|nr:unnamed protein product [Mytilus coruscus]